MISGVSYSYNRDLTDGSPSYSYRILTDGSPFRFSVVFLGNSNGMTLNEALIILKSKQFVI